MFCGSATRDPFSVNTATKVWKCHSCGREGNHADFLALRSDALARDVSEEALTTLARDRGVALDTLRRFGTGVTPDGIYTIPQRMGTEVVGVRLYRLGAPVGKRSRMAGRNGLIMSRKAATARASGVWVVEGEWDAMVLDQALREGKSSDVVVGLPGAGNANEALAQVLQDKHVMLALDHDAAGVSGEQKIRTLLIGRAKSVRSVHWPRDGKVGHDIRDEWDAAKQKPNTLLMRLRRMLHDDPRAAPEKPGAAPEPDAKALAVKRMLKKPGFSRGEVMKYYRRWMHLPNPEVLDVIFGTVLANRLDGDPLWLFVVGPAGCGKTALLMPLSTADEVITTTTLTPTALISGAQRLGSTDPSLIPKLNGKVLVVKDFTTILELRDEPRKEIFGVLRDAYDGRTEKYFGTGLHRVYNSRFGIVAGVTPAIEKLGPSHSVVGERFLKYYMRREGPQVRVGEAEIRRRIKNRGKQTRMHDELCAVARDLLTRKMPEELPSLPERVEDAVVGLAQWVALMRGAVARDKYTHRLQHMPTAEIGTRVAGQLLNLATGISVFRGKRAIDGEELAVLTRVARDSSPDILERLVQDLYLHDTCDAKRVCDIAARTRIPTDDVHRLLEDAEMLRVVEHQKGADGVQWQLSRAMEQLMRPLNLYAAEKKWRRIK